jgi:hypothetical protein
VELVFLRGRLCTRWSQAYAHCDSSLPVGAGGVFSDPFRGSIPLLWMNFYATVLFPLLKSRAKIMCAINVIWSKVCYKQRKAVCWMLLNICHLLSLFRLIF